MVNTSMDASVVRVYTVSSASIFLRCKTSPITTDLLTNLLIYDTTTEGSHGKYDGEFLNGLFDGEGTLYMPDGSGRYEGTWEKGKLVDGNFIFNDDLVYEEEKWGYCTNKVGDWIWVFTSIITIYCIVDFRLLYDADMSFIVIFTLPPNTGCPIRD